MVQGLGALPLIPTHTHTMESGFFPVWNIAKLPSTYLGQRSLPKVAAGRQALIFHILFHRRTFNCRRRELRARHSTPRQPYFGLLSYDCLLAPMQLKQFHTNKTSVVGLLLGYNFPKRENVVLGRGRHPHPATLTSRTVPLGQ